MAFHPIPISCRSPEVFQQDLPAFLVFLSDEPQSQEKASEGVFLIGDFMFFGSDPFGLLGQLAKGCHQFGIGLGSGTVSSMEPGKGNLPICPLDGQVVGPQGLFEKASLWKPPGFEVW
jgi:hypothetical protein